MTLSFFFLHFRFFFIIFPQVSAFFLLTSCIYHVTCWQPQGQRHQKRWKSGGQGLSRRRGRYWITAPSSRHLSGACEFSACVHTFHSRTHRASWYYQNDTAGAVACADSGALSCLCIGAERASSRCMGGHASATTHRIMSDLPPPAAWAAAAQARIIQAVCFHISYNGEDILLQLSRAPAPAFGDARCFGL